MARAHRYEMALPIRYRPADNEPWLSGTTVNISRSGVLFQGERPVGAKAPIEMDLVLPREVGGSGGWIIARGSIVRGAAPATREAGPKLAATIVEYDFVRNGRHN